MQFAIPVLLVLCLSLAVPLHAQPTDGPPGRESPEAQQVRESTRDILARPEFRRLLRTSRGERDDTTPAEPQRSEEREAESEPLFRSRPGVLEGLGSVLGGLMTALAWLAVGLVCALVVFLVVRAVMTYERRPSARASSAGPVAAEDEELDHPPGELPADEYVARARKLAGEGRYREAVAQLLLGAMSHVERSGMIRYRRGLTCRDYLRAVRPRPETYTAMRSIVKTYEPLGFGRREATREHFEQSLDNYEAGFRATSPALES